MKPGIAVLSNVNMNYMIRLLKKEYEVYDSEGYGNELGILMNPASSYHSFDPQITFLVMDLMEVLEHELEPAAGASSIERWFGMWNDRNIAPKPFQLQPYIVVDYTK